MSGLTESIPGARGWRLVENVPSILPKPSRQIGIDSDIVRKDIADTLAIARRSMPKNVLHQNKRGLTFTFAITDAACIAKQYERRSKFVSRQERAIATAEYWRFIADNIARMKGVG